MLKTAGRTSPGSGYFNLATSRRLRECHRHCASNKIPNNGCRKENFVFVLIVHAL